MRTIKCEICGKEVQTSFPNQKTCKSLKCDKELRKIRSAKYYQRVIRGEVNVRPPKEVEKMWQVTFRMSEDLKWSWSAINKIGKTLANSGFKTRSGAVIDFQNATGEMV